MIRRTSVLFGILLLVLPATALAAGERAGASPAANESRSAAAIDEFVAFHRPLIGSWNATVEAGDKVYRGTLTWRLAETRKSFTIDMQLEGIPTEQAMVGFDPATGKIVQTAFDSEGTYTLSTLEIAGANEGKTLHVGPIGKWEDRRFSADGKATTATSTVSCTEMTENRIVLVWSNRKGRRSRFSWARNVTLGVSL